MCFKYDSGFGWSQGDENVVTFLIAIEQVWMKMILVTDRAEGSVACSPDGRIL